MTAPADPNEPVIDSEQAVRDALAQRFVDNALSGDNAANDDIITIYIDWKRQNR